jgi:mRNA-degrading endonuclease RelE of RelBE toxin-antitoxin system
MNWILVVANPARKDLGKIPDRDRQRILRALDALQADPFSGDIKRLEAPAWRRRSGSYRIFYDLMLEEHLIVATAIKRRTTTTY